ncbi:hypothetical protein D047_0795B, partial [Vibrio parahaemolyticus VPTS-2010_2]
AKLFSLNCY